MANIGQGKLISLKNNNNFDKMRMLDSRMTEQELCLDQENSRLHTSNQRNTRRKQKVVANAILNHSYDDLRNKMKKKRVNTTHRKPYKYEPSEHRNSSRVRKQNK